MSGFHIPSWIEWTLMHFRTALLILAVVVTGGIYGLWRIYKRWKRGGE